mgnify:FL=1
MKRYIYLSLCCLWASLSMHAASYSGTLPVLHILTENNAPIVSKDDYINATYYLDAMGQENIESIGSATAPLTMEIKGRGNYTWKGFDKKPYRLKLTDKQPLLGMTKSKHFALLAHADDSKGFMRNAIGFELARLIGMTWTPMAKPVEVVLNGDYIGLYFLTETIRVDKDRVNIVEQEDDETDPSKVTGGWLVEIDNYNEDPHVTIKEGGEHTMWITYKTPEVLSSAQEDFLTNEMRRIDQLVYGDKNSDKLWEVLDIDALARFYIVQELTDNYESFHGSCYLYREMGDGEKWKFGPAWDFGSAFNRDKSQYLFEGDVWHNHWIPEICKFPAFQNYIKSIWDEFCANNYIQIFSFINQQKALIASAAAADAKRWPQYGNADLANRVTKVADRLHKNAEWLNKQWGSAELPDNPNTSNGNPEYQPDDELTAMYVWTNGKMVEYNIAEVDSITFAKKAKGIVVKTKIPSTWKNTIYVWIWGDGVTENEHIAMKQGDWYVFAYDGTELNIIFKQNQGWTGNANQSEDLKTTRSGCYVLTQKGEEKAKFTAVNCD